MFDFVRTLQLSSNVLEMDALEEILFGVCLGFMVGIIFFFAML